MRVLIYGNRKQDDYIYDVSTPEKEARAFIQLFQYLDEDQDVYAGDLTREEEVLYKRAKEGDADAAKKLLTARRTYEYEEWRYGEVISE